ncbi:MAG: hypothetical protein ACRC7N_00100 [Clostridium sp.]
MNKFIDLSLEDQRTIEGGAVIATATFLTILTRVISVSSLAYAVYMGYIHECGIATTSSGSIKAGEKVLARRNAASKATTGRYHCYTMCSYHR